MQSNAEVDSAEIDKVLDREFKFTDADFERVRKTIYAHAGISLSSAKRNMVYSRMSRRLRATGIGSFDAYLDHVESGDVQEYEEFINSLTTNLTSFFREPHHFPIFSNHLRRDGASQQQLVWCTAASTGEEPYSIAMTAVEAFGSFTPPVKILASDLDTNVLAKAQDGIYPTERIDKIETERLKRFFQRGAGKHAGMVRVRKELTEILMFMRINLLEKSWPIRGPLDAIFCRNVMIYFDKPTQLAILERFAPLLKPDGLLFMGHSESLHHASHLFHPCGQTVYRLADSNDMA